MRSTMTVEEREAIKEELLRDQKFALLTAKRKGAGYEQATWLNKLGLSDFVIGMETDFGREQTTITLKVPVDRAKTMREYIGFTETPCWGDVAESVELSLA